MRASASSAAARGARAASQSPFTATPCSLSRARSGAKANRPAAGCPDRLTPAYSTLPAFLLPPSWATGSSSSSSSSGGGGGTGITTFLAARKGHATGAQSKARHHPSGTFAAPASVQASSSASFVPSSSRSSSSLSAFFDANSIRLRDDSSSRSDQQRSHEAIAAFRDALNTGDFDKLAVAYQGLVTACRAHYGNLDRMLAQSEAGPSSGAAKSNFRIRKADLQTAVRSILRMPRLEGRASRRLREHEAQLARRILDDMQHAFRFNLGFSELHYLLWSYCDESPQSSTYTDPVEAFEQIRSDHPGWRTTSVDWNLVIKAVARRRDLVRVQQLIEAMHQQGVEVSHKIRNTVASLYFSLGMVDDAEELIAQIGHLSELPLDTFTITVGGYCMALKSSTDATRKQYFIKMARRHAMAMRTQLTSERPNAKDRPAWLALLRYEAQCIGPDAALQTARKWAKSGDLSPRMIHHLLVLHEHELADLQTSDEALALLRRIESVDPTGVVKADRTSCSLLISSLLGQPPPPRVWQKPLQHHEQPFNTATKSTIGLYDKVDTYAPSPNQIREAQLFYNHLVASGIVPDATMITPLVFAYCDAFLPSLPSALKLLDDLLGHATASKQPKSRGWLNSAMAVHSTESASAPTLDVELFNALLRGCAKVRDVDTARKLLHLMARYGIRIDATSKLQAASTLMQISSSWEEAFELYRKVGRIGSSDAPDGGAPRHDGPGSGYSAQGYSVLLDVYRKLKLPSPEPDRPDGIAPPEYVLTIVQDMRDAGHQPSCATYTSLLDYYGKALRPAYSDVWATHQLIKQDETLEPDMPLVNALLNAYNRAGEPGPVLAIWHNLMANRQEVDGATLSIVLDTAGRNGLLGFARKALVAVRRLEHERWSGAYSSDSGSSRPRPTALNKGAWDAWLECLARCGRLEEAVELAFGNMAKQLLRSAYDAGLELVAAAAPGQPIKDVHGRTIGPDAKTMQMLLKFAAAERDRQRASVRRSGAGRKGTADGSGRAGMASQGEMEMTREEEERGGSIWHDVRARIRDEMPWLWDQVKTIGTGRS